MNQKQDDPTKALYRYMAMQIIKAVSLLGALAIIGHEISKLRGGG